MTFRSIRTENSQFQPIPISTFRNESRKKQLAENVIAGNLVDS